MPDQYTPHLGLVQPVVGASATTWGDKTNANFALIDDAIGFIRETGGIHQVVTTLAMPLQVVPAGSAGMVGAQFVFVPTNSTRALVSWGGSVASAILQLLYGTGTPPRAGAGYGATPGATLSALLSQVAYSWTAAVPFAETLLITGLLTGRQYWLGVQAQAFGNAPALMLNTLRTKELIG